jgi:hypothetical protein
MFDDPLASVIEAMPLGRVVGGETVTLPPPVIVTETTTCDWLPLYTLTELGKPIENPDAGWTLVCEALVELDVNAPPWPLAEKSTCDPWKPVLAVTENVSEVEPVTAARIDVAPTPVIVPGTVAVWLAGEIVTAPEGVADGVITALPTNPLSGLTVTTKVPGTPAVKVAGAVRLNENGSKTVTPNGIDTELPPPLTTTFTGPLVEAVDALNWKVSVPLLVRAPTCAVVEMPLPELALPLTTPVKTGL